MNTKLPLLALSLFVVGAAHAQLSYTGYSEKFQEYNVTKVGNYASEVISGFASPDAYIYMDTIDSWAGDILHINHEPVPEPATLTLLVIPALAALNRRRKR